MDAKENKLPINIEEEMRRSYLDYAMSVIIGRALPDVRDGLKPVHRRVLYAMYDTGNTSDKPYRKSARTVGTVIGKYHPHGDQAVYDTIVRMAQDFSMRYTLVDGQGNFGSVDGDPAAAMRYTEIRLDKLAHEMLRDIEKETVDFGPTTTAPKKSPWSCRPQFPNLLVNGSSGSPVGMATNMPPHNLGEVVDVIKLLVENPDVELAELMKAMPGPDFPTAGFIYGIAGIRSAYETGAGVSSCAGAPRSRISSTARTGKRSSSPELPIRSTRRTSSKRSQALVRDKRSRGISDIRDESDRDGIRMVLELKRDENPGVILNNLYKFTKLQSTFGVINLAIVHGTAAGPSAQGPAAPFRRFRREVVVRRTQYDLRKAEERAHILEGLKIAIDNLDEVITIIRQSKTPPEAKRPCASLPLQRRPSAGDPGHAAAAADRSRAPEDRRRIRRDAQAHRKAEGDPRQRAACSCRSSSTSSSLSRSSSATRAGPRSSRTRGDLARGPHPRGRGRHHGQPHGLQSSAPRFRRTARSGAAARGRIGMTTRDEDAVRHLFIASTHDYILVFTSSGKMYWLKVHEIPDVSSSGQGQADRQHDPDRPDEKVCATLNVREFSEGKFVVMASRKGFIKKTSLSAFSNVRANGIIALSLDPGDDVLGVDLSTAPPRSSWPHPRGNRFVQGDGRPPHGSQRTRRHRHSYGRDDRLVEMEVLSASRTSCR
jgi:DNA gyrase subunit A